MSKRPRRKVQAGSGETGRGSTEVVRERRTRGRIRYVQRNRLRYLVVDRIRAQDYFNGKLKDVRIYRRALTTKEISELVK